MKATPSGRRSMQVKALLSLGMLVGLGAVSTLASWTGNATATSNITAATVALGVGATAADETNYIVPIAASNWYPGMSQAKVVVVKNTSSIALPYSIAGSFTEVSGAGLGNALNVVVTDGMVSGVTPNFICSGNPILTKATLQPFLAPVVRNPLESKGSESFCVQYTLPLKADNALQGAVTSLTLTFTATVGS